MRVSEICQEISTDETELDPRCQDLGCRALRPRQDRDVGQRVQGTSQDCSQTVASRPRLYPWLARTIA